MSDKVTVTINNFMVKESPERLSAFPKIGTSNVNININANMYKKIMEFADYYNTSDDKTKKLMKDPCYFKDNQWAKGFLSEIKDPCDIVNLITVSESLGNPALHTLACMRLCNDMSELSLTDFRDKYNISQDLDAKEIEQLKAEDASWRKAREE